jgi:hypothetical protein
LQKSKGSKGSKGSKYLDVYSDHFTEFDNVGSHIAYNFKSGNSECKRNAIYCHYKLNKTSDYKMT